MARVPEPSVGAISFQFLAEITVGATARIDLCRVIGGERDGQLLAVKRLLPHIAEDPSFSTMFLDEVWMTALVKHPNVVEVAGWGQDVQGAYLAVELVQGVSLARLMKTVFDTGEVFSERMVVFVASRICRGLAAAHKQRSPDGEALGLVHRDLTPGNVLLGFNGDVKIADFGLAKAKQRLTKTLTGLLKGQPQYMSPEQAKGGQDLDGRSDLFSLGVLLFELFAARRPWSATSELEMVHVAANEPPLDLREYRPKIDKELVSVVMTCLERDPAQRFQSAGEVQQRLETWLSTHGYADGTEEALARFVRRNAMRQMRWFERAVAGELAPMPDSMRPGGDRTAPRVPSYTNVSNAPLPANRGVTAPGSVRARVRPRRQIDSETTDVTDVEAKMAALHADAGTHPPRIVEKDGRVQMSTDIDWGEEVPTLVKKEQHALMERARVRPRPAAGGKAPFEGVSVNDEDSQRTTAVKRPQQRTSPELSGPAAQAAVQVESDVSDPESEEVPTLPLDRGIHRPPAAVHAFPFVPSPGPRHPGAGPTPLMPGTVMPERADVVAIPSPRTGAIPAVSAQMARLREGSPPSGIRAAAEPMSVPPSPRRVRPIDEEVLLAEADRLAVEAVRMQEEAKAAAAVAGRKTAMARMAGDAAMIAAEAVRIAATAGLPHGARRLEEALSLEAALRRGEIGPIADVRPPQPASVAPPAPVPAPVAPLPMAPLPVGPQLGVAPPPGPPALQAAMLPDPARAVAYETGPVRANPDPLAASGEHWLRSTFDPQMFRAQLKPRLFGMPRGLAIALMAAAFVAFIVLLWVVV